MCVGGVVTINDVNEFPRSGVCIEIETKVVRV